MSIHRFVALLCLAALFFTGCTSPLISEDPAPNSSVETPSGPTENSSAETPSARLPVQDIIDAEIDAAYSYLAKFDALNMEDTRNFPAAYAYLEAAVGHLAQALILRDANQLEGYPDEIEKARNKCLLNAIGLVAYFKAHAPNKLLGSAPKCGDESLRPSYSGVLGLKNLS